METSDDLHGDGVCSEQRDEQTCQLITVEEANNYRYFCFICDLNEYFYLISSHEWGKIWTVSVERQKHHVGIIGPWAQLRRTLVSLIRSGYICKLTNELLQSIESAESLNKFPYLNDIFLSQDSASTSKKEIWNSLETRCFALDRVREWHGYTLCWWVIPGLIPLWTWKVMSSEQF